MIWYLLFKEQSQCQSEIQIHDHNNYQRLGQIYQLFIKVDSRLRDSGYILWKNITN